MIRSVMYNKQQLFLWTIIIITAEEGEVGNACRQKGDNSIVHYRGNEHVYMYMYNVNLSDDNDCLFICTGSKNLLPKP